MKSSATPTRIIRLVAPIPWNVVMLVNFVATDGIIAIIPNARAPIKVILVRISFNLSAVGFQGFTPGIAEPYFLRLFAISFGCILGIIEA